MTNLNNSKIDDNKYNLRSTFLTIKLYRLSVPESGAEEEKQSYNEDDPPVVK